MSLNATYDAYVPSSFKEFFAKAKFQPAYTPFNDIRLKTLTPAQQSSFDLAQKITVPGMFHHSIRCFYFSLLMLRNGFPSNTPGVPQISSEELVNRVFHACILHDLGMTQHSSALSHPACGMSFELHGGIMAYEHLKDMEPKLLPEQLGDIVQGIMLHTIPFTTGRSSATGFLVQLSAFFDLQGYQGLGTSLAHVFDKQTVREIEKKYPRGSLVTEIVDQLHGQIKEKPNCLLSHMVRCLPTQMGASSHDTRTPIKPLEFASRAAAIKSLLAE
ncbi:hypothetical protein PC9H_000257 [Pleurotus ostreatus]|uniref:HD domain-containing protein n=1 Tax=Pleurotus ostreatus TaxID=5322 RepID=A0A8H7A885_PLEOS|nr:uncharacterized protein PC9H_000257 [Pleurotus ostreatus]KAF7439920.1 hypothetical protein PC9H_000257 [Pleurotus ostreatus]